MNELEIFRNYLNNAGLKVTKQRLLILESFLKIEEHVSAEELFDIIKGNDPLIGQATVFRTLKVLVNSGIAAPVEFSDKTIRYEHSYNHSHHDHLVCTHCGEIVEFTDEKIEIQQNVICKQNKYLLTNHRLEIFGICSSCQKISSAKK
jgi:Fur family transcriptional regulator, ferric uptake regulator